MFRVIYEYQLPNDQYGLGMYDGKAVQTIGPAFDPIHAEQIFWDLVRATETKPLEYAVCVESIREYTS